MRPGLQTQTSHYCQKQTRTAASTYFLIYYRHNSVPQRLHSKENLFINLYFYLKTCVMFTFQITLANCKENWDLCLKQAKSICQCCTTKTNNLELIFYKKQIYFCLKGQRLRNTGIIQLDSVIVTCRLIYNIFVVTTLLQMKNYGKTECNLSSISSPKKQKRETHSPLKQNEGQTRGLTAKLILTADRIKHAAMKECQNPSL